MKELLISDLMDDICPDEFGLALEEEPVSPARIRRILRQRGMTFPAPAPRRRGLRLAARITIAAALALALSVTVYAVANYTDFFAAVFGGKDAGRQTYSILVDAWDEDGNQKTKEYVMEGQPVDQDAAQALLGDKVADARSVTVGDYTCTVENLVMAENGVGVMTYSIEAPNGLPDITVFDETRKTFALGGPETDDWTAAEGAKVQIPLIRPTADCMEFLMTATDTRLEAKAYFLLFDGDCPEALGVDFFTGADAERYRLTVPLPALAEAVELVPAEGWSASISPIGLTLKAPSFDDIDGGKTITVHFADGSTYLLYDDLINNCPVSLLSGDGTGRYAFNRLVDPAEVTKVTVQRHDDAGALELDLTFTK